MQFFYRSFTANFVRRHLLSLSLILACVVLIFGCSSNKTEETANITNGVQLPERIKTAELKTLDGKTLRLGDYAGKVVVLDLWATWCGPCQQEIPHLVDLQQQYDAQGLQVIGLDFGNEPASRVNEFAEQLKINYKLAYVSDELAPTLMAGYDSIPQTYIISRDGKILHRFVGFHPVRTPEKMRQIIEEALKQKA